MQLPEISRPAVGQVDVGVGSNPHRNGRQLHQRGVRSLLTAEHHHRFARRMKLVETATQQLRRAEDPRDDQVTSFQDLSQLGVGCPRWVGQDIVRATPPSREQVCV